MLETVRQYALDRLRDSADEAQWRGRHLAYFVATAEEFLQACRRAYTVILKPRAPQNGQPLAGPLARLHITQCLAAALG